MSIAGQCEKCCCAPALIGITIYGRYCNDSSNRFSDLLDSRESAEACMLASSPTGFSVVGLVAYNSVGDPPQYGSLVGQLSPEDSFLLFSCPNRRFTVCWKLYITNNVGTYLVDSGSSLVEPTDYSDDTITLADLGISVSLADLYSYADAATPVGAYNAHECTASLDFSVVGEDEECP